MVIAVAGMVGSGKTTVARRVSEILTAEGLDSTVLRFQSLPCFTPLRSALKPPQAAAPRGSATGPDNQGIRWAGYRPRRLGVGTTVIYLARILSFRVYCLSWSRDRVYVLNRYFYDLFAHYRLETAAERACCWVLRAVMPVPDIAILVVATQDTITTRRPEYSREYVSAVGQMYARMRRLFPELVELRTDPGVDSAESLKRLVLSKRPKS